MHSEESCVKVGHEVNFIRCFIGFRVREDEDSMGSVLEPVSTTDQ